MTNRAELLAPARQFIDQFDRFAIFTHLTPDGDALGSAYALCVLLRGLGKEAVTILLEVPPPKYSFPQFDDLFVLLPDADMSHFEAGIAVDCATENRLAEAAQAFSALPTLSIDHHVSNDLYADVNCVAEAPATAELIYELFQQTGSAVSMDAAGAIYMGIIADTGNLTYPSTTPRTFEICAKLAADGLDTSAFAERIFNTRTYQATKLIGQFIRNMKLYADNRIAFSHISRSALVQLKATPADTEALVNYARDIDTVEVAVFLREVHRGRYKVSLRSKGGVDVSAFAEQYGGGGHPRAAGCMIEGTRDDIISRLEQQLEELLA